MCSVPNLSEIIADLTIYHPNLSRKQLTNLLDVSVQMTDRCKQLFNLNNTRLPNNRSNK